MRTLSNLALVLMLLVGAPCALGCSDSGPPPFASAFTAAKSVFVFRLESATLERTDLPGGGFSEWVEGRIRVLETIKGPKKAFTRVFFTTEYCGGRRLDVGNYFLVATTQTSADLRLRAKDVAMVNISLYYGSDPEAPGTVAFLTQLREASAGAPLPEGFPSPAEIHRTLMYEAPPNPSSR